jgi:hypothetical protein
MRFPGYLIRPPFFDLKIVRPTTEVIFTTCISRLLKLAAVASASAARDFGKLLEVFFQATDL